MNRLDAVSLELEFPVCDAIAMIAAACGDPVVTEKAAAIMKKHSTQAKFNIHVSAAQVLCQAMDGIRKKGLDNLMSDLEGFIQAVKENKPRLIQGVFR